MNQLMMNHYMATFVIISGCFKARSCFNLDFIHKILCFFINFTLHSFLKLFWKKKKSVFSLLQALILFCSFAMLSTNGGVSLYFSPRTILVYSHSAITLTRCSNYSVCPNYTGEMNS